MAIDKDRFRKALNKSYSKDNLFKLFKKYLLDWIAEGYIGSNLGLFEISLISETTNKQTYIDLMEQMYSKESSFKNIFKTLPEDIQKIFEDIAWNGSFKIEDRSIYFKENEQYSIKTELKDEYLFFTKYSDAKQDEYLTLNNDIVRVMRKFMKKPKDYLIHRSSTHKTEFFENNEKKIQKNLKKYLMFFESGEIQLSNSGKILKESKHNMKRYCSVEEYYLVFKDLEFLKTETMGLFLFLLKDEYRTEEFFKTDNLKNIVLGFLDGTSIKSEDNSFISLYLNFLKGIKNVENSNGRIKRGLATIKKIIEEFPKNGFVSIDNIIKSIIYRDEFIEIIDEEAVYTTLYINEANYERSKIIGYEKYRAFVIEPFIKSVFFILATLGVFEVCYDEPSSADFLYLKNRYLSKYDGIKYVKLTELGNYIFNRTDSYEFEDVKDESRVILDDDRLIVTLIGESPIKSIYLEKFGTEITPNKFKISEETILKNTENIGETKKVIKEFKDKISDDLPDNWNTFFNSLLEKTELITYIPEYKVLKLKNNKELLSAITTDKRFKSLILKGEDLHIIVKKENLDKVSCLFKEYGYFLNIS